MVETVSRTFFFGFLSEIFFIFILSFGCFTSSCETTNFCKDCNLLEGSIKGFWTTFLLLGYRIL